MNLFINALTKNWVLIIFDNLRKILFQKNISILGNESEKLIEILDDFLKENKINYKDLENIVVVNWPWSFTWIRTIVLLVNTINFVINKNITAISFFDLFNTYPIVKSSSKRDSFFKKSKSSEIEIIKNDDLLEYINKNKIEKIYWENDNLWLKIFDNIDYSAIIKNIKFQQNKQIEAFYVKKPSIT